MLKKQLLIIGYVWPEPTSSAAGRRMIELIWFFLENSWSITFATPAVRSPNMFDLEKIGVVEKNIKLNSSTFDDYIKDLQPNVVLFDRFMMEEQFGWRVAEYCPQAIRILDTEDLHFLRMARETAFKQKKEFNGIDLQTEIAKREVSSIYRCDLSLIISRVEYNILAEVFKIPNKLLLYLPFLCEKIENNDIKQWPAFNDRKYFITIGNFKHAPNWDVTLYLKQSIWPLIRKQLPEAEMHIYGAYPDMKVRQLHNEREGFLIKGSADDVAKVMQYARLCLSPLRFGAGLKGKFIDAMENGTPSVTTSIGAEGISEGLPWNGYIADTVEDIVAKAVKLYQSEKLWYEAQRNGINIINTYFDPIVFKKELYAKVQDMERNLTLHRKNNFFGSILLHHTVNSTKYMARWIEEKNKKGRQL